MKENSQQLQQDIKHDREMIESSFNSNKLLTPKEMKERFGKFGWENMKIKYKLNEIINL